MSNDNDETPTGMDRRTLIRRGAIAGTLVWAAPVATRFAPSALAAYEVCETEASQTFTTVGSDTFTVPADITSIIVEVWGGGGGIAGGGTDPKGGGGGGGYAKKTFASVAPGDAFTLTVGAGGMVNSSGADTQFFGPSTVTGSGGGQGGNSAGAGGGASGGDINVPGGEGGARQGNAGAGGGGGGSGPGATAGQAGASGVGGAGGSGTAGGGGAGGNTLASGQNGGAPGGGAGGRGEGSKTVTTTNGNGANGQVKVTWIACVTP